MTAVTATSLTIERVIPAPPNAVYRAWLEPEMLRRWLAPGDAEVARAEVDERVGGRFRIWQSHDDQSIGGFDAEIVELVPAERIVFNWGFVGPDRDAGPVFDSTLTVTFDDADGGRRMTLVHERLDGLAAALPDVAANVAPGWENVIDKLVASLQPR